MLKIVWEKIKKIHLIGWIFIAMILGVVVGILFPSFSSEYLVLLSNSIFLPMIKACIVPLVFSTLVVGIAGHGDDLGRVGRLAWKSLSYFICLTFIALFIGLGIVNAINPGIGVNLSGVNATKQDTHAISLKGELNKIIQPSFFQAAIGFDAKTSLPSGNGGEVLAIVFMAAMFSAAIITTKSDAKNVMLNFFASLSEVMFSVVNLVMNFAPFGIFGAMAATVGHSGIGILSSLAKLIGCLYLGLGVFLLGVLLPICLIARVPLMKFLSAVSEPILTAFATASSDAALPIAMENMVAFGVPKEIVSFVIPTGYTFNLDGTTLYLAVASVFAAQASGVEVPFGQQVYIMLILMLTSKGVAAVPRASLVVLAATIDQFGFNPAAITVILGVDEIMDMARTAVNVVGNCLACVIIAKWEGVLNLDQQTTLIEDSDKGLDAIQVSK